MVKTTWRCGTGASTSLCSHSAQRSCFFFSHDGQKLRPRQEMRNGREYTVTRTYKKNLKDLAQLWIGTDGLPGD